MNAVFRFSTGKYTRFVVVGLWLVIALALGSLQPKLQKATKNDPLTYLPGTSDAAKVVATQRDKFASGSLTPALVLMSTKDGKPLTPDEKAAISRMLAEVDGEIGQKGGDLEKSLPVQAPFTPLGVAGGQVAKDGAAAFAIVPLTGTDANTDIIPAVKKLRALAKADLPANLVVHVTGGAGVSADAVEVFQSLDGPLLIATALLVLVLLVITYRSPVIWTIPLLSVMLAYLLAAGLVYVLVDNGAFTINGQTTSILIVLMFGAGTDYCLLMVSRLREELHRHESPHDAVVAASQATFGAIMSSGSTVVAAMLMLLLASLDSTATMGPVLALGIIASMLSAFTLLPALLSIGGRWAFWPRVPGYDPEHVDVTPGVWHRVGRFVQKSPMRAITMSVIILGILTLGNLVDTHDLGFGDTKSFSKATDSSDGYAVLAKHYAAGQLAQTTVIVKATPEKVGGVAQDVADALRKDTKRVDSVLFDVSRAERSTDKSRIIFPVILANDPFADSTVSSITDLRDTASAAAKRSGGTAIIGGQTAQVTDTAAASKRDQRVIIPAVLVLIFLILVLLLRAVVAPIHLVLSVVLSFFATLGFTTWLFVNPLGHPGVGDGYATYLFIFAVALGVDYNIFLVHRIREETTRTNTVEGTVRALGFTGSVITSAGIILAGTFLILATLPVYSIKQIGIGVAIGVLLDTFLVRSFLVPAMMISLGDRNWWPGRRPGASAGGDASGGGDGDVAVVETAASNGVPVG